MDVVPSFAPLRASVVRTGVVGLPQLERAVFFSELGIQLASSGWRLAKPSMRWSAPELYLSSLSERYLLIG